MLTILKLILKFVELMTKFNESADDVEEIINNLTWFLTDEDSTEA